MVCVLEVAPRYKITFCKGIRKGEAWYFYFVVWKPRHRVAFMLLIAVWEAAPQGIKLHLASVYL